MSIRMLRAGYELRKHTFQDDMEALLWVVLYCGLFYLPHDLSTDDLTTMHTGLFERSSRFKGGHIGGEGKSVNASDRLWTNHVQFGDAAFAEWINTVMDYHRPPPELKAKYKDMWTAERLDAFWKDFLQSHNLERDNRTVHEISRFDYIEDVSMTSLLRSSPLRDKRPPDDHSSQQESKKARAQ